MFIPKYCQRLSNILRTNLFSGILYKPSSFLQQKNAVVSSIYQKNSYVKSISPLYQPLNSFCTIKQQSGYENEGTKGTDLATKKPANGKSERFFPGDSRMTEDKGTNFSAKEETVKPSTRFSQEESKMAEDILATIGNE